MKLIQNFLTNRKIQIKIEETLSSIKPITAGVPQGSTLSPFLFNIFINDLPQNEKIQTYLYADDLALSCENFVPNRALRRKNSHLIKLAQWLDKWHLSINANKSSHMEFNLRKHFRTAINPVLNGNIIPTVSEQKLLGILLTNKLQWTKHINATIGKAIAAKHKLWPILNPKCKLDQRTKIRLVQAFILPILSYASPITCNTTALNLNKLIQCYKRCIRLATSTNKLVPITEIHQYHKINKLQRSRSQTYQ